MEGIRNRIDKASAVDSLQHPVKTLTTRYVFNSLLFIVATTLKSTNILEELYVKSNSMNNELHVLTLKINRKIAKDRDI